MEIWRVTSSISVEYTIKIKIRNRSLLSHLNNKLNDLISDESFVRWIKGTAGPKERNQWDAWEKKDRIHRKLKREAKVFYQLPLELDAAGDLEAQLESLNHRIDQADQKQDTGSVDGVKRITSGNEAGYRLAVAAAIILLLAAISILYLSYPTGSSKKGTQSLYTSVEVGYGETSLLKFSDGSRIRLNAHSTLRYKLEQFNSDRVEVWLEGEGYFDISPNLGDQKREFIVHTPEGYMRVLGTKFNVNTRFEKTSVVLEEGSVEVSLKDTLNQKIDETIMKPGERAILTHSSPAIAMQKVDVNIFTAWLDGEMEFNETSLRSIVHSIEATYGVTISVGDSTLLKQKITGKIQNPDLKNLLTGLRKILDLEIEQTNKKKFMITRKSIHEE